MPRRAWALRDALARESLIESVLVADPARPTTRKVRFVSEHFSTHMLRADWERAAPASADIEQNLIDAIVPRKELKQQLCYYLDFLTEGRRQVAVVG